MHYNIGSRSITIYHCLVLLELACGPLCLPIKPFLEFCRGIADCKGGVSHLLLLYYIIKILEAYVQCVAFLHEEL